MAGRILNTDKDTARLSFVKDILANDFFIAPYKDNSPLVAFNNPESRKNKSPTPLHKYSLPHA